MASVTKAIKFRPLVLFVLTTCPKFFAFSTIFFHYLLFEPWLASC
jgi:hypothetical protein